MRVIQIDRRKRTVNERMREAVLRGIEAAVEEYARELALNCMRRNADDYQHIDDVYHMVRDEVERVLPPSSRNRRTA